MATALFALSGVLVFLLALLVLLVAGSAIQSVAAGDEWRAGFRSDPCPTGGSACLVRRLPTQGESPGIDPKPVVPATPTAARAELAGLDPVAEMAELEDADLTSTAEGATKPKPKPRRSSSRRTSRTPVPGVEDADCSDLSALEPGALGGELTAPELSCLENNLVAAAKMTDKSKISRVLMINAKVQGDTKAWEKLVRRHLDAIDRSDPNISYTYALHLAKSGHSRALGAIRWASVALDNKSVWTGDEYTSRVYSLHQARAGASRDLWQHSAEQLADGPTDALEVESEQYRNQTKTYAREWAEYGRDSGKDITTALALCRSAASDPAACDL